MTDDVKFVLKIIEELSINEEDAREIVSHLMFEKFPDIAIDFGAG